MDIKFSEEEKEFILTKSGYKYEEVDVMYYVDSHLYSHGSANCDDGELKTKKVKVAYKADDKPTYLSEGMLEWVNEEDLFDNVVSKVVKNAILRLFV